jgi:hypothetical protein
VSVAAAGLLAQALTVRYNYAGNWTGLFHHDERRPLPPELRGEAVFLVPEAHAYDGQMYHLIAHDPWLQRGFARFLDDARLRYRRILVPALAYAVAGDTPALHAAYVGWIFVFTALGSTGVAVWAMRHGRSPAWGVLFLFVPATFVSLDRLTGDVALASLCVAFVLAASGARGAPFLALVVLAPLVRETGLLLWAAAVGAAVVRREWRRAGLWLPALVPALAWFGFVSARTPSVPYPNSFVPLQGIARAFLAPPGRGEPPADAAAVSPLRARWRDVAPLVASTSTRAALLGALVAIAMGLASLRTPGDPASLAAAAFATLAVFLQRPDNWLQVYDFGRVYSPLLVVLAMRAVGGGSRWGLLPLALMAPSLALQTSGQVTGILRGLR